MHFFDKLWTSTTYVVSLLTLSPVAPPVVDEQVPLLDPLEKIDSYPVLGPGPVFKPPTGRIEGPGSDFVCNYTNMKGWTPCSTPEHRDCWLQNNATLENFTLYDNYETKWPTGVTRHYQIEVTDEWLNADGMFLKEAKLFNGKYPGPWIQACWGDQVVIEVHNALKHNGTSIHWHGIRQLNTTHMDGVNGITQCPIAPGDSFTYNWTAMQYGSSWYHSHYSVQYADGALGPMTLHGPSSAPYDEAKLPLLMTDWGHNSAFNAITAGNQAPSILLNGIGNVTRYNNTNTNTADVPTPYRMDFTNPRGLKKPKRYLLRLINTSFETTFVFSIDGHWLQIVGADFVPIHPYKNTSVLIGIGQRYHVIVEANDPNHHGGNYWIRTWRAHCFLFPESVSDDYEQTGTLSYSANDDTPHTSKWDVDLDCADEKKENLKPIIPWNVSHTPSNGYLGENLSIQFKKAPGLFPLALASIAEEFSPLQINYGDPTLLHLNFTGEWPPLWVVFKEDYTETSWVYMVIKGHQIPANKTPSASGQFAHPIHLHGHDFAILEQAYDTTAFPTLSDLDFNNPARRDVVLAPGNGYVVIAFKTDNPGPWIMHCHIATHASFGLALQIMERQEAAAELWPSLEKSEALETCQLGCNGWNKWWGDCNNWWPGDGSGCKAGENGFGPDSGI